jgi:ribosomal protein S18 acetylase RimI-like enzyme
MSVQSCWTSSNGKVTWTGEGPSPFELLRLPADPDLDPDVVRTRYAQLTRDLRTPDADFFTDLANAQAILLDPETRKAAIAKLFSFNQIPGQETFIVYHTYEATVDALYRRARAAFALEIPSAFVVDDLPSMCTFDIEIPLHENLLDGFIIPNVKYTQREPEHHEWRYRLCFILKVVDFRLNIKGRKVRAFRRLRDKVHDLYIEHTIPLELLMADNHGWKDITVPSVCGGPDKKIIDFIKDDSVVIREKNRLRTSLQPGKSKAPGLALEVQQMPWVVPADLPRKPFLLDHRYEAPKLGLSGADAYFVFQAEMTHEYQEVKTELPVRIDIRSFESEDQIPEISELIRGKGEDLFGHYSFRAFLCVAPCVSFMAFDKEKLVGAVIGSVRNPPRRRDEDPLAGLRVWLPYAREPIRNGYLALINVDPNYRQKQIGAKLIEVFLKFCREVYDIGAFTAELMDNDQVALDFYESLGFVRIKHVPRYYPTGEGSFWMYKDVLIDKENEWHEAQAARR